VRNRKTAKTYYCLSFFKGCFFLFPTFCLETKGGAKNSSRFKKDQSLTRTVVSIESALHTTLMLHGPNDKDSASCFAKQREALYSAICFLKN
jgi:hypothetical protein